MKSKLFVDIRSISAVSRMASLLKELRTQRGISLRHLAQEAGVNPTVASRAERGKDAKLSTWEKLFEGLGYLLILEATELCEEAEDLLQEEAARRQERQREGLCAGKHRFY